jgi:type I restriction enzyme S subunit
LEGLYKAGEKISRPGDVVLTSKGTVGRFAFVREETPQFVYSPQLSYWRSLDFNTINPRFLFYWIQGEEFQEQADGVKSQTDMADYVSLTDQRRMKITLPPLEDQRAIARILGALDDKIELNRRMNHTLEEMARALFKSWFMDFDPVTAKAEGRVPLGMNAETAFLFPAEFEETDEGSIPKDWKTKKLEEIIWIKHGFAFKGEYFSEEETDDILLTPGNFKIGGGFNYSKFKYYKGAIPEDYILKHGDLIVTMTDLSKEGDTLGYSALVPTIPNKKLLHNQRIGKVQFLQTDTWKMYLYFLMRHNDYRDFVVGGASGTTVKHTSPTKICDYKIALPSLPVLQSFKRLVEPWITQIEHNDLESSTLASIRDALLPQLLSGELRVKQAEKVIENM